VKDGKDIPGPPEQVQDRPAVAARGHLRSGRRRAAARGVLWSLVNMLTATLTTAVVFLVTSRFLAPVDFGVVAMAVALVSLAGVVAPIAFGEALIQRADVTDDHLDTVFWITFGIGALVYVLIALAAPAIAVATRTPVLALLLPFIGLRLVFEVLATVPNALIVRAMKFRLIALRTAVANLAGGAICLAMVWQGFGLWALAASQVIIPLAALMVLIPAAGWRPGRRVRRRAVADLWHYGVFASGNRLLQMMRLDQLLIGLLAGPAVLGAYFFAFRLFQILTDLTAGVLSPVSHVLMASLHDDPAKRREAFLVASFVAAAMAFPIFAGLIVVADSAVPLVFGPHWADAVPAVQGLAVIGLLAGVSIVQAALILGMGRADWWFRYQALVQFSLLPLLAVLIDEGLATMIAGMVAHRILLWPISVWMTLRLTHLTLTPYLRNLACPAAGTVAMVAAVLALRPLAVSWAPGWGLGLEILTGVAVYLLVAGILCRTRLRSIIAALRG